MSKEKFSSYCARCGAHRNHEQMASVKEVDDEALESHAVTFSRTIHTVRCMGCDSLSVCIDDFCSDPAQVYPDEGWGRELDDSEGKHTITYWPAPRIRRSPEWARRLPKGPLKRAFEESYDALNADLRMLAASGTRIVFDLIANDILKYDAGDFGKKLDALETEGYISRRHRGRLKIIIDAGSAAQHRGHRPEFYDLPVIFGIMEGLLYEHYIADQDAKELAKRVPARPKQKKEAKDPAQ